MKATDDHLVEQYILRNLQEGLKSFDELLQLCHSLYPTELNATLERLEAADQIIKLKGNRGYLARGDKPDLWRELQTSWDDNLERANQAFVALMHQIPQPHNIDYEWWFTHMSREELASKILTESPLPIPERMVFLASPLFGAFVSMLVPDTDCLILDKSSATLDTIAKVVDNPRLSLVNYDAENPLPDEYIGIADFVFFDPPWYLDYYDLFFRRSVLLASGKSSVIANILFPVLTRSTSFSERRELMNNAGEYGLSLVKIEEQAAHYLTPEFELQSLRREGIKARNWRKGDLAFFVSDGTKHLENRYQQLEQYKWVEALIDRIKVKVKIKEDEPEDTYFKPEILKTHERNATLASVSRRDPFREQIDLWTSTHQGYKTRGWKALWIIAQCISRNEDATQAANAIRSEFPGNTFPDSFESDIETVWQELYNIVKA
ncbi:hypothetical protein ACFL2D_01405 [Patescibacteria group bacterium]